MAAEISLGDQHEDQQVEFDLTLLYQSLCPSLKGFVISKHTCSDQPYLILTHEQLFNHPPFGLTSRVRILIKEKEYVVHVLLREVQREY